MLNELFIEAFNLWDGRTVDERPKEGSPVYDHFKKKLEPAIAQIIRDLGFKGFVVKASVGMGNWAEIPWIGIRHSNAAQSFEQGEYVVYLFSPDFKNLYLSMNQGVSKLGTAELEQKTAKLREKIFRPKEFSNDITGQLTKVQPLGSKPDKYQKGSIYAQMYQLSEIPDDTQLIEDLRAALGSYQNYLDKLEPAKAVFWKFSPGSNAMYWEEFKTRELIAMGSWGEKMGNLSQWLTVEDMRKSFPGLSARAAHELIRFRDEVEPGHIIVAYGNRSIYGFGRVPEDSVCDFDENKDVSWWGHDTKGYQHWRKIDWIKVFSEPVDISREEELYNDLRQNDTIHRIDSSLNRKLEELMQKAEQGFGYPTRQHLEKAIKALGNKSPLSKEDVLNALERIMTSENIKMGEDWKNKTWENILKWADEIR